jgi:pyruvate-ferredoxin/flavodoxin oxidoreductase
MIKQLFEKHLLEKTGGGTQSEAKVVKYPGVRDAIDGNTAVILVEREASDAAGAYPITPPPRWASTGPNPSTPPRALPRAWP